MTEDESKLTAERYLTRMEEVNKKEDVDLEQLLQKMSKGDKKAGERVVSILRRHPDLSELVMGYVTTLERTWIDHRTNDAFTRFSLQEQGRVMRRDLLGADPTPLERLLVERIVVCALQVQIADTEYVGVLKGGTTFTKAKFYADMMDRAQRRYLAAIRALAQVRRLQLPPVAQLNLATNQVNVAAQPQQANVGAEMKQLADSGAITVDDMLSSQNAPSLSRIARMKKDGHQER